MTMDPVLSYFDKAGKLAGINANMYAEEVEMAVSFGAKIISWNVYEGLHAFVCL